MSAVTQTYHRELCGFCLQPMGTITVNFADVDKASGGDKEAALRMKAAGYWWMPISPNRRIVHPFCNEIVLPFLQPLMKVLSSVFEKTPLEQRLAITAAFEKVEGGLEGRSIIRFLETKGKAEFVRLIAKVAKSYTTASKTDKTDKKEDG